MSATASRAYSVSEVTSLVRDALATRPELEDVLVEGEVSNINVSVAGHVYFTLKDRDAALSCVVWRTNAQRVPFRPENGMTLIAHGALQVYAQQGRYQLYADRLEPSGVGGLALAVEQLKRELAREGLFDERRKRPLPLLPARVVVVTSRTGAAWRDVHTVMSRRAPGIDIVLSPATVQGEGAAETIARALRRADAVAAAEVILLVRGGGSLEDLMPFNSETVARAIRATRLPVVTGVGHETDTTVADLAADRRAPTPSAAAELVAPSAAALRSELSGRMLELAARARDGVTSRRRALETLDGRLQRRSPALLVAGFRQELDRRGALLRHSLMHEVAVKRRALDASLGALREQQPRQRLVAERLRVETASRRLGAAAKRQVESRRSAVDARAARLASLSPRRTLERGYSITLDDAGRALRSAAGVARGTRLRTLLHQGVVESEVTAASGEP